MNKKELIRVKEKKKTDYKKLFMYIAPLVVLAICVAAAVFLLKKPKEAEPVVVKEPTLEELYTEYIGPADCEAHREWLSPTEYYSLFGDDAKELELVNAFFGEDELRGIVPCGMRLTPVMLSYEDFNPYESPIDGGFASSYACSMDRASLELQLASQLTDFNLSGSYDIERNDLHYISNVNMNITDAEYYTKNTFNPDDLGSEFYVSRGIGEYGFIEPVFNFGYSLNGDSLLFDSSGNQIGNMSIEASGSLLENGSWRFTADLTGQKKGICKTGKVYIRATLPCNVVCSKYGEISEYESTVNVYYQIDSVLIGTWVDCL